MLSSGSEDDDDSLNVIRINEDYKKKYEIRKDRDERMRLQDKYGVKAGDEVDSDVSESTSESEDSDAEMMTENVEKNILRTLSMIRKRDPRIYDANETFFEAAPAEGGGNATGEESAKKKKEKRMTLRDFERKELLEKGAEKAFAEDEDDPDALAAKAKSGSLSYFEEQAAAREALKRQLDSDDSDDEDIFQTRPKTVEEKQKEEADYRRWLRGEKSRLDNTQEEADFDALGRLWRDPNLDENEQFLRDYVLGRQWTERKNTGGHDADDEEDEAHLDDQDEFERAYNFRFEEPDGNTIQTYPRNIDMSLRRKDERRKEKRKERETRKEHEKEMKREEMRRLKNLKKKEIFERLKKIKELSGMKGEEKGTFFDEVDLDGEFDEEAHNATLAKMFNDDFYAAEESEKPVFDDEETAFLGLDEEMQEYSRGGGGEDGDGEEVDLRALEREGWGEADAEGATIVEGESKRQRKQRRKRERRREEEGEQRRLFEASFNVDADETEGQQRAHDEPQTTSSKMKKKTFDEYAEELYQLDMEDVVAGEPTRFKYRPVPANDFGLSTEEVLLADERDLNKWVSVKRMTQYRDEDEEARDRRFFRKRGRNFELKRRVLTSLEKKLIAERQEKKMERGTQWNNGGEAEGGMKKEKKKKRKAVEEEEGKEEGEKEGKKKRRRMEEASKSEETATEPEAETKKKKKKKKGVTSVESGAVRGMDSERLAAYGIKVPKKKKKKSKKKSTNEE